jgi:hypothetical protein
VVIRINVPPGEYHALIERNSYSMKGWYIEHMQKTIVKYVAGISNDASLHQRRLYKKYGGNLSNGSKELLSLK